MKALRLLINGVGCAAVVTSCVLLHGALNYLALAFFLFAIPAATTRMIAHNDVAVPSLRSFFGHRLNYWCMAVGVLAVAINVASGAGDRLGETSLIIWPAAGFILLVHAYIAHRLPADMN